MLKISNVCKNFDNTLTLDNINMVVKKNSIVGLAGPSGCGKSTLLRCIQRLESVDTGNIECNCHTGFMFQDFQLFPHMTVLQNLIYAPMLKLPKEDHVEYAMQILDNLGITAKAYQYPQQLSGGQKQRVALARSLMLHPDLLLCDEPTSGLDVTTTLDVAILLKSIRNMGITMLIASHDLKFLDNVADYVVNLQGSKIT